MNTRAVIVDDEELARRGIRALLQRAGDVEIVSECGSGEKAIKTCLSITYRLVRRSRQRIERGPRVLHGTDQAEV